jgi:hypothetical protein
MGDMNKVSHTVLIAGLGISFFNFGGVQADLMSALPCCRQLKSEGSSPKLGGVHNNFDAVVVFR